MTSSLLKIGPANPILLRVVTAGGRRFRHALTRWIYLGLLIVVLLVALSAASGQKTTLSEAAKASWAVYKYISYVQLAMICLLAPVFTAGAITQERDARTYNILLATPLTNTQILVGSLFSRLFYVLALLLSGLPVFAITLFFGGLTTWDIAMSFSIAASTALFTGSLAMLIAVFRLGSGKTVFWFYVFNAVYLVGLWYLDSAIRVPLDPRDFGADAPHVTTFLTGLHPFLALESVVRPTLYVVPPLDRIASFPAIVRWYLQHPAGAYVTITFTASMAMIIPCAMVLRRIAQRSDVSLWQSAKGALIRRLGGGETRRKVRHVWANPVAWREAATRASVSGRGITRWLTIIVGIGAGVVLVYLNHLGFFSANPEANDASTRYALQALVTMEFSVALLVAANTSASAVTRERESQTLDLLLATPITSRYYIWGKLRGLVSFMLPFALVPGVMVAIVVGYDLFRHMRGHDGDLLVWPEMLVSMPVFITAVLAWACMLGLNLSLKFSRTIIAVMATVGVLMGVCGVLGICGFSMATSVGGLGLVIGPLSPFTAIAIMLNPMQSAAASFGPGSTFAPDGPAFGRFLFFFATLGSAVLYCVLTFTIYRSMVKNFDIIIRRQHQ